MGSSRPPDKSTTSNRLQASRRWRSGESASTERPAAPFTGACTALFCRPRHAFHQGKPVPNPSPLKPGKPRAPSLFDPVQMGDIALANRIVLAPASIGVERHANGYLIDQLLRDGSNQREDAWGSRIENRTRLLHGVVCPVASGRARPGAGNNRRCWRQRWLQARQACLALRPGQPGERAHALVKRRPLPL